MDFYNSVIDELRRKKFMHGYKWVFIHYNVFRNNLEKPLSLKEFQNEMEALCDQGIFIKKPGLVADKPSYELTKLGEELLYRKD